MLINLWKKVMYGVNTVVKPKKEKPIKLRKLLKGHNISLIRFIFFYLNLVSMSFKKFWYEYFRYFMLIIWRRTLLIWGSLLAYINITEQWIIEQTLLFKTIIINLSIKAQLILVISLFILWIFRKIFYLIYKYFFNYRDLLNFNEKIINYYAENTAAWILKNSKKDYNDEKVYKNDMENKVIEDTELDNPEKIKKLLKNKKVYKEDMENKMTKLELENKKLHRTIKELYNKDILNYTRK